MRKFDIRSYIVGAVSGAIILVIFFGAKSLLSPPQQVPSQLNGGFDAQAMEQFRQTGSGGMMDADRVQGMADRFGMTVEELQAELDAGKTLPEIAQEHGVDFSGGMRSGSSGTPLQGTGSTSASSASAGTMQEALPGTGATL